jgi:hypothetical protein
LPREEFLYDFKRRLRAARKRAVLAAEYRGTRVARIPPARRSTAPPGTPTRLLFPSMVKRRKGEEVVSQPESSAGHRPRAFARCARDPAPRRGPVDLRRLVGMHTARPLSRAGKRVVQPRGMLHQFRGTFFLPPPTAAVP